MKTNNFFTQLGIICLLGCSSLLSAQQTTIDYNSDTGPEGPHMLIKETGDNGSGAGQDGWARLWFQNSTDLANRWGFLGRPQVGATDNDGVLTSPLVMAYTGVQKFGFGSDGTLRINKQYSFPNMDGANGDVLTTDGNGNVSWLPAASSGGTSPWTVSGNNIYRASGRVGIGTTVFPTADLEIKGAASSVSLDLKSTATKQLNFKTNASVSSYISDDGNSFKIYKSTGGLNMEIASNNKIVVVAEGAISMIVDDEKVTVGGGLNPSQTLDVLGKIEIADDSNPATAGAIRYSNGVFEGYNGTQWQPFNSPNTVKQVINAADLNPGDDAAYFRNIGAYSYVTNLATNPDLNYSLPVPVGATLTKVSVIALDNSTTEALRIVVSRNTTDAGGNVSNLTVGSLNTTDTGTNTYQNFDVNTSMTLVNNDVVTLRLYSTTGTNPTTWPNNDLRVSKIIVEYIMP